MTASVSASAPLRRAVAVAGRGLRAVLEQARLLRIDRVLRGAALVTAVVLVLVEAALGSAVHGIAVPLAFLLAVAHSAALPLATRVPNVAAPLGLAAALALQALSAPAAGIWPWWPAMMVTHTLVLAAVAARARLLVPLLHWVLALGASAALAAVLRPGDPVVPVVLTVFGAVSAGAIVVALLLAQWRRVRSELLHERRMVAEEAERRLLAEERARIARELHDVVAHGLSLIAVQTSTARFRHADLGDAAIDELDRIGAQSRQALDEMRGLLRVLRGTDEADLRPQPGLDDLPALVAQAGGAGPGVVLETPDGDWAAGIGPVTALAAYRIVQEAISNALRHASGAPVRVTLDRTEHALRLAVVNAAGAATAGPIRPGHGLVGMAERAASAGGTVRFGPEDDGGYAVRAVLPLRAGRTA
ncbi:sensor histidine kinase [Amnibacterium endophyticum]|uniref:histidine kinase n=1 Tax=Amnibacterium endophyticum TaxID=2109337 RepID=A0ABW4LBU3_9MICO